MARAALKGRTGTKKRSTPAASRGRTGRLPGIAPHLQVEAPPAPKVPEAVALAETQRLVDRARAALFTGTAAVVGLDVGGLPVEVAAVSRPGPHWLLATRGLWPMGVELTMRVPRGALEQTAPAWALAALAQLLPKAGSSLALEVGRVLPLAGPVAPESEVEALVLGVDPRTRPVETPRGPFTFVCAVGLCRDEAALVREWSPSGLLEILAQADPALLTDPERQSLLTSPRARTIIAARAEREGSSLTVATARHSSAKRKGGDIVWRLSPDGAELFVSLLKGRIAFQRAFSLQSDDLVAAVSPANAPAVSMAGKALTLQLSLPAARALRAVVKTRPGSYQIDQLQRFVIEVIDRAPRVAG